MPNHPIDVEQRVMQKIVRLEQQRTRWWLTAFWLIVATLSAFVLLSIITIGIALSEKQSLLVLSIFGDGWTMIREGWLDAFRSIWYDIPHYFLFPAIFALLIFIITIILTRRNRAKIKRQRSSIATYNRDHQPPVR